MFAVSDESLYYTAWGLIAPLPFADIRCRTETARFGSSPHQNADHHRKPCDLELAAVQHGDEPSVQLQKSPACCDNTVPLWGRRNWLDETSSRLAATVLAGIGTSDGVLRQSMHGQQLPVASAVSTSTDTKSITVVSTQGQAWRNSPTKAICDPTVSVWQKTSNSVDSGVRTVVLLGTAHISQLSAELAGQLVRDVRPNAVFVELDLKRVARIGSGDAALDSSGNKGGMDTGSSSDNKSSATFSPVQVVIPNPPTRLLPPPPMQFEPESTMGNADPAPPPVHSSGDATSRGNWFTRGAMNWAASIVGKSVQGMYSNLSDAGFKPGEEFATAMRAGQEIGASIVLGDQDVQVTLRRLTEALAATDLNQLLSPNSALEKSMAELIPSQSSAKDAGSDPAQFKRELTDYVERLKSRDSVRRLMSELNEIAPALVQVMLTERDAYMAAGLDTLNQFNSIVAVMGIAHQDGVEQNLRERGWKLVPLTCPKVAEIL